MGETDDESGQPQEKKTELGQWNTGFVECNHYYCKYFWFTMCCPCCAFSQECAYVEAFAHKDAWGKINTLNTSTCSRNCHSKAWCAMGFCFIVAPLFCLLPCHARGDYRKLKGLKGDACVDFFTSWCCVCCDMAQVMNEIHHEEIKIQQYRGTSSRMESINFGPLKAQSLMPLDTQPLLTNRL
jgi:Cys-rich protein (TIGR01571 family)